MRRKKKPKEIKTKRKNLKKGKKEEKKYFLGNDRQTNKNEIIARNFNKFQKKIKILKVFLLVPANKEKNYFN